MKTFKVNATIIGTMTIKTEIEAKNIQQATIIMLTNAKDTDWVRKTELKTNTK